MVNRQFTLFSLLILYFFTSCKKQLNNEETALNNKENYTRTTADYLAMLLSMDTLSVEEKKEVVQQEKDQFTAVANKEKNPFYYYISGLEAYQNKAFDEAQQHFTVMQTTAQQAEVTHLKELYILYSALNSNAIVDAALMEELLLKTSEAEKANSSITFRFYDALAQAYFKNRNPAKALEYATLHFENHPLNKAVVVQQRYYEISLLLAITSGNEDKIDHLRSEFKRLLAQTQDPFATARYYDLETFYYNIKKDYPQALASSQESFNQLKKLDALTVASFNNLATSFIKNNLVDSALTYYKEGLHWADTRNKGQEKGIIYSGLSNTYKIKGDYKNALIALDSCYKVETANQEKIKADFIAELQTKYETEKKDSEIALLKTNNDLNQKVIKQQWRMFTAFGLLIVFAFLYMQIRYRQRLLRERNQRLETENKKMQVEQRALQLQLNPHFIYNSIANLQGLIVNDQKRQANEYLLAFSTLMRNILEHNRCEFITLKEELTTISNYVKLQQMRYANKFEYTINCHDILTDNIEIPPMLLQPFVENAIEHGFAHIDYAGKLSMEITQENQHIHICITDNGKGLNTPNQKSQTKKSLSQTITQERLDLHYNSTQKRAHFEVVNNADTPQQTGVIVHIYLPILID